MSLWKRARCQTESKAGVNLGCTNHQCTNKLHQSTAASMWWCGLQPLLGWVEMAVGLPESASYPGHSPQTIFSSCCFLDNWLFLRLHSLVAMYYHVVSVLNKHQFE